MPTVNGKKFPYTAKGKSAAKKAAQKEGPKIAAVGKAGLENLKKKRPTTYAMLTKKRGKK